MGWPLLSHHGILHRLSQPHGHHFIHFGTVQWSWTISEILITNAHFTTSLSLKLALKKSSILKFTRKITDKPLCVSSHTIHLREGQTVAAELPMAHKTAGVKTHCKCYFNFFVLTQTSWTGVMYVNFYHSGMCPCVYRNRHSFDFPGYSTIQHPGYGCDLVFSHILVGHVKVPDS